MTATIDGHWAHAVPLDPDNDDLSPASQRVNTFGSQESSRAGQRASTKRTTESMMEGERDTRPQSRRPSVQSNNSSGPRKRPSRALRQQPSRQEEQVDDSPWIHRDKLAQIEILEMEEAGMHVRQPRRSDSIGQSGAPHRSSSRSASRSGLRHARSKENIHETNGDLDYKHGSDEFERKRVSTIPAADEEEGARSLDPTIHSELRTPEEVAATEHTFSRQHMIRPSTSRIPISKASPVPVPHNVVERDSPLPRSRSGSTTMPGSWEELQYARRNRSGSVGSGVLLDEVDDLHTPPRPLSANLRNNGAEEDTSLSRSPPKSKGPQKDTTAARKAAQGARAVSGQRPPSSSGHKNRPSTSHNRPEGEAPWIATMYKPDPRLPADQQLLPTHAKRMLQEQWEKEGKTGTAYDRDLRLINDQQVQVPPEQQDRKDRAVHDFDPDHGHNKENFAPDSFTRDAEAWPLTPTTNDLRSGAESPRPGTSGGYRITPSIASPPTIEKSPASPGPQPERNTEHKTTTRVPDLDEKDEVKSKKGCCCVVM